MTASTKGTVIRVFNIPDGAKLFTFKRGMHSSHIYNLCFTNNDTMAVCTSDRGTVHIFRLSHEETKQNTWGSYLTSAASYILPESYSDTL